MTLLEQIELAALLITVVSVVWRAARVETRIREAQAQSKKDLDGLGKKTRDIESRQERRWKHMIATQIETAKDLEHARKFARLLREDAWRD
jgi:hypothetical protein